MKKNLNKCCQKLTKEYKTLDEIYATCKGGSTERLSFNKRSDLELSKIIKNFNT